MIVYHVTRRENRESIMALGLVARDTTLHNFPFALDNADEVCVFGTPDAREALDTLGWFVEWAVMRYMQYCEYDVWAFDSDPHEVHEDAYQAKPWYSSVRVYGDIAPENVRLIDPVELAESLVDTHPGFC